MGDLSFAPLLAEHAIECTGPGEVTCRGCRERGWMSRTSYRAHLEAVLLAEVARVLGSDEAVEASARAVAEEADDACFDRLVAEGYSDTDMEDVDYWRSLARAALAALTRRLTGDTR